MSDTGVQTAVTSAPAVPAVPVVPVADAPRPAGGRRQVSLGRLVLQVIGSLRVTVVLFALSLVLVFVGTLAQKDTGIWTVVTNYFRSWYVWVPFQVFFPSTGEHKILVDGAFPFFGGKTLGIALLLNVLVAHALRFRFSWWDLAILPGFAGGVVLLLLFGANHGGQLMLLGGIVVLAACVAGTLAVHMKKSGVLVLHVGLIVLLVGELVTGKYAVEGTLTVLEGQSVNYIELREDNELAFVDTSGSTTDRHIVIPASLLRKGGRIRAEELPFDVELVQYMTNSELVEKANAKRPDPATAGLGLTWVGEERREVSGADPNQTHDIPAAYVKLFRKGTDDVVGTYLVTPWFALLRQMPKQWVEGGDKRYELALRWKRVQKDYTIHLLEFKHGRYRGTGIAKDFTSLVRLVDPANGVDRQVAISMNDPLRYRGETFFQASVVGEDVGTVLQVVKNPAWVLPYAACVLVAAGMLMHFGLHLFSFLSRRAAA
jgi:hypothetical protein